VNRREGGFLVRDLSLHHQVSGSISSGNVGNAGNGCLVGGAKREKCCLVYFRKR